MSEVKIRIKTHFSFSKSELRWIIITVLLMGIVLGFDDGLPKFEPSHWLFNLFNSILIAFLGVMTHISFQRVASLAKGYLLEFRPLNFGLLGGLVFGLATLGKFVFFVPFELVFKHHEGLRLGRFRYGLNYFEMATVAITGPLSNLLLAVIFKAFFMSRPSFVLFNAVKFNVLFAIATLLPVPKAPGSYLLMGQPFLFFATLALVLPLGLLLVFMPLSQALLIGLLVAIMASIWFFVRYEYQ